MPNAKINECYCWRTNEKKMMSNRETNDENVISQIYKFKSLGHLKGEIAGR